MKKLFLFPAVLALLSCTSETYDTGDGSLSFLHADFVEMHTVAPKSVDWFTTDEEQRFDLSTPATAAWAEKADTLYRALAYYTTEEDVASTISLQQVYVLRPEVLAPKKTPKTDPVGLESIWLSPNGRYINMGLLLKIGTEEATDNSARHTIGVAITEETPDALSLTLAHDQGGVPEYYTQRVYASIPVSDDMRGKTVTLSVNTYQGTKERTLNIPD